MHENTVNKLLEEIRRASLWFALSFFFIIMEWVTLLPILCALALLFCFIASWCFRPTPIDFQGKHVVIVGGSSGIGLAMAHLVASEGAKLSIIARNTDRLAAAKSEIESQTHSKGNLKLNTRSEVFVHSANVISVKEAKAAIDAAIEKNGPVSVLICSQGISKPYTFEDVSFEVMHEVMDTNYWGCVNSIHAALSEMKKDAGKEALRSNNRRNKLTPRRIAVVSSQAGQVGLYGFCHYAASKFALRGFCESLQQEVYPYGIRVSMIFPPDTETPQLIEENKTKPEITKIISGTSKAMNAEEVAKAGVRGIKSGAFFVSANFEGFLLTLCTAGMSPQPFFVVGVLEALFGGFTRLIGILFIFDFYRIITKNHTMSSKRKKME